MTTTTHTPVPWYTSSRILYSRDPYRDGRDRYIGYCDSKEPDARSAQDSAFIIRACNAHEGLVAALTALVAECQPLHAAGRIPAETWLAARDALRAAKGEE